MRKIEIGLKAAGAALLWVCLVFAVCVVVGGPRLSRAAPPSVPAEPTYTVGRGEVAEALNVTARGLVGRIQAIERLPREIDALDERVRAIEALLAGDAEAPEDAGPTPQTPTDQTGWTTPAEFAASCVRCHNATKRDGGVDFTNRADFLAHLSDSVILVWLGKMPKNSPPLSDDQTSAFVQRWKTVRGL